MQDTFTQELNMPEINAFKDRLVVYLVTDGEFFKIGRSKESALERRLGTLQIGNARELTIARFVPSIDAVKDERFLHERMNHCHVRGEWFQFRKYAYEELHVLLDDIERRANATDISVNRSALETEYARLWDAAVDILIATCEENDYKPAWVMFRLLKLNPTQNAWEKYAKWQNYRDGWASIKFQEQSEILPPPTQKGMLLGIKNTKSDRIRANQRRAERLAQPARIGRERKIIPAPAQQDA